jgi:TetR/AcrR family transcriptional regulator, mexJK operon transcriptional repressor
MGTEMLAKGKRVPLPKASRRQSRGRPPLDDAERQRILDATATVFLERGFAGAGTNEIARRAHASKQTLYRLFPSKADLFVAVIGGYMDGLFARHVEFVASGKPARETLNEIGCIVLSLFTDPKFLALYRIVVAEAHSFPKLARELWSGYTQRGYDLLAEYLKSRRIGGPAYRKTAAKFVSFILGDFFVNAMLNPDTKLSRRALELRVERAVEDFLHLHPAGAARKQG